jgi:hypothetical protein
MADDGSAAMALARSISNAIDADDIQRNWVKVASIRKLASAPLASLGDALFDDKPIDGLDILSIEPHLIAKTILDYQDDDDDLSLSHDELAQMFEDFANISDGQLDVICAT